MRPLRAAFFDVSISGPPNKTFAAARDVWRAARRDARREARREARVAASATRGVWPEPGQVLWSDRDLGPQNSLAPNNLSSLQHGEHQESQHVLMADLQSDTCVKSPDTQVCSQRSACQTSVKTKISQQKLTTQ
jgi:hypothetical protein